MLYMKTRMTFRVAADLAAQLRELPNQTAFVESALRTALGIDCPACEGTGRLLAGQLEVSNFKSCGLSRLDRDAAIELRRLVRVARSVGATRLELSGPAHEASLSYVVSRGRQVVLTGTLSSTPREAASN